MITIYQRSSCSPKKVIQFNRLTYKKKVDYFSRSQLITILSLTE